MDKRQFFAKRLRELRKSKGLTQKELGQRLNVTDAAVGMWEQARRLPDPEILSRLAGIFGVSIDYLLGNPSFDSSTSPIDEEITQIMKELGPDITLQFYDLKGMTDEEKESLKIFLQGLKARREQKKKENLE